MITPEVDIKALPSDKGPPGQSKMTAGQTSCLQGEGREGGQGGAGIFASLFLIAQWAGADENSPLPLHPEESTKMQQEAPQDGL